MKTPEYDFTRQPLPSRMVDNIGGYFSIGAIGGSAFHFLKGVYQFPNGERFSGGIQAVRMNGPRIAGAFAVWCGLSSIIDLSLVYVRQKEDPWNTIISTSSAAGALRLRRGISSASRATVYVGLFFSMVEGFAIWATKFDAEKALEAQQKVALISCES